MPSVYVSDEYGNKTLYNDVDEITLENEDGGTTTYSAPKIDDVYVNGKSVVENRVAQIIVPTRVSQLANDNNFVSASYHDATKQNKLTSGSTIKTINNTSLLGSGNIDIGGKIDLIKVNGVPQTITDKTVDLSISEFDPSEIEGEISAINEKIPDAATKDNQLADKAFVNSSIQNMAAIYVTKDASGNPFDTKAALLAGPYYHAGASYTPHNNDYALVKADEEHDGYTTRYIYVVSKEQSTSAWNYQYTINDSKFTQEQLAAINSKATETKINKIATLEEDVVYSNNLGTTIAVGGIAKGTTFNNKQLKDILEDMLYPYVAFNFTSVSGGGTYEYGTTITVSSVTPTYTNGSTAITSTKAGTTSGGDNLYSGATCTSGTAVTLTSPISYTGSEGGTIYMTLSDGRTTTTKSTSVSYTYYDYAGLTDSTTAPTSGLTRGRNEYTYSYTPGQYLWILSPTITSGKIQTNVLGQWVDVTTTSAGTITYTLSSGDTATYYAYRTDAFSASGEAKYKLIAA